MKVSKNKVLVSERIGFLPLNVDWRTGLSITLLFNSLQPTSDDSPTDLYLEFILSRPFLLSCRNFSHAS